MRKKTIIFLAAGVGAILVLMLASSRGPAESPGQSAARQTAAEKIEVVHFHGTQQCWSCIKVGEYALSTVKNQFPKEYENGTIVFLSINGELPKNLAMVRKFKATGSSLFINSIGRSEERIEEDIAVWRLVANQQQFENYLAGKLNRLLGRD